MRRRRAAVAGLTCTIAASTLLGIMPSPAFAEAPHMFRVDVLNAAESKIKVRFRYSGDATKGRIASYSYNGAKEMPTDIPETIDAGNVSEPYAVQTPPDLYDSGYWLEVSRADDPQDRSVVKFYRHPPKENNQAKAIELTDQRGTSLRVSAVPSGKDSRFPGFDGRLRIIVTDPAAHTDSSSNLGFPGRWDRDISIGEGNGGWTKVDEATQQWKVNNLLPNTDYWFRCYNAALRDVWFNGRKPKPEELGGSGQAGFWRTSNDKGEVSLLRDNGTAANDVCDVHVASPKDEVVARQITRKADGESPIYKFTIPSRTRLYEPVASDTPGVDQAIPDAARIPPYVVEGRDSDAGEWSKIGIVLPASAPQVDASGKKITYGGATFYFQNKPAQKVAQLRVSGGYTGLGFAHQVIKLNDLKEPTLTKADVNQLTVKVTTNVVDNQNKDISVEANGAVQEQLDLTAQATKDDHVVSPSEPGLGDVYDYVYYTAGPYDQLVTGMHNPNDSADLGGKWAVSAERGPTINTAVPSALTTESSAIDPTHAYLSATDPSAGKATIRPRLDLDKPVDIPAVTVKATEPQYSFDPFSSGIGQGVNLLRNNKPFSPADPGWTGSGTSIAPVYRIQATGPRAVERPFSVAVTRYRALIAASDLPRNDLQKCAPVAVQVNVQTDKLIADPVSFRDIETPSCTKLSKLTLNVVSKHGTQVDDEVKTG